MEVILINYSEFLDIKNYNYSMERIKYYVCKHLGCKTEDIEDIFFDYKLFIIAFMKQGAIYLYKSNVNYSKLKCRYCVFCKKRISRLRYANNKQCVFKWHECIINYIRIL